MLFNGQKKAAAAVQKGDLVALRKYLESSPKLLEKSYRWDGGSYSGYLLNMAAFYNKADIVAFLITEKNVDPNRSEGVANNWTPLHHAEKGKAFKAAAKLLQLGATPSLASGDGNTTLSFTKSADVQQVVDPFYQAKRDLDEMTEKQKQRKERALQEAREIAEKQTRIKGKWTLTAAAEVTHERDLPDGSTRLTDIFNFETRLWRAVATNLKSDSVSQNIIFFDAMPDTAILQTALQKLKELGGSADENAIPGSAVKKALKSAPAA